MSKEQFELKKPLFEAIPANEVILPNMPVAIAIQEAEDLYEWCQPDKAILMSVGFDWGLAEDLPARIGACRYAQSSWQKEYKSIEDAQKEWNMLAPAAYDLRNTMVHFYLHAYRKMPDIKAKVQKIADGSGHSDMLQDLHDASVLGESHPEPLKLINFDMSLLPKAAQMSDELANLLAKANGARLGDNKLKLLRDKAYTYMKVAVDELKHHGQFAFWRTPDRLKGYKSTYLQRKNGASASKKNKEPMA